MESVTDRGTARTLQPQHHDRVARVHRQQCDREDVARHDAHFQRAGDHQAKKNRKEECEVAASVEAHHFQRDSSTTLAERDRRDAHHEQRYCRKHQRRANDRTEPDCGLGRCGISAGQ